MEMKWLILELKKITEQENVLFFTDEYIWLVFNSNFSSIYQILSLP